MLLNSRKATTSFTRAGPFIGLLCEHWLRLRWVQRMVDILDESSWPPACLVPPSWHECGLQRSTHPWVHSHPFFLFSLAHSKPMINQLSHLQLAGNLTTSFFMWDRRLDTLYKLCPGKIFFLAAVFQHSLCTGPSRSPWTILWQRRKVKVSLIKTGMYINYCLLWL